MAEYHKYVFNSDTRSFVGEFEELYKQDECGQFDSWHQDDLQPLNKQVLLHLLQQNFHNILDLGCGKGALTNQLKNSNNNVLGIDISPTAIKIAKNRYPNINFLAADVQKIDQLNAFLIDQTAKIESNFDLIVIAECLSYIEKWRELIRLISNYTQFIAIVLYIPLNPIGFVKSAEDLIEAVLQDYELIEFVSIMSSRSNILYAKSKKHNN